MTIRLHIDRLVLEGAAFTRVDRARVAAAVQARLAMLLREAADVEALSAHQGTATLRAAGAGPVGARGGRDSAAPHVPANATSAQWGTHIASAVHGALTQDARGERRSHGGTR